MKISRMNRGNWGKVRAFFDIATSDGFTIKGFKIIEGINGLFVSMPSQKGKDDEYFDTVWLERELRDSLNQFALDEYNSGNTLSPESNGQSTSAEPQAETINKDNAPESAEANKSDVVQPFSEDDIPF